MKINNTDFAVTLSIYRECYGVSIGWCLWFREKSDLYSACLEIHSGSDLQIYDEQIDPYFEEFCDDGGRIKFKVFKDGKKYEVLNEKLYSNIIRRLEKLGRGADGVCKQFANSYKSLVWMDTIREDLDTLMFPNIREVYVRMVNYWNRINSILNLERL